MPTSCFHFSGPLPVPTFQSCSRYAGHGCNVCVHVNRIISPCSRTPLLFRRRNSAHISPTASASKNKNVGDALPLPKNELSMDTSPLIEPRGQPMTHAEQSVIENTTSAFSDGRYGTCPLCSSPIAVPGLVHALCSKCGWIDRRDDVRTVAPGHHD